MTDIRKEARRFREDVLRWAKTCDEYRKENEKEGTPGDFHRGARDAYLRVADRLNQIIKETE